MQSIFLFFVTLTVASLIYHVLASFCAILFHFRKKKCLLAKNFEIGWPKVSCLKPLCGNDSDLAANLETFLTQDYPDYEVIFGIANPDDPALTIASQVCAKYPKIKSKVVSGEVGSGTNLKVRNLRNIAEHISPDAEILVLSDSDIRVTPSYLKEVLSPIRANPKVSVVTSLYKVEEALNPSAWIEALSIEATFIPGVLVASTFADLTYAFGATIALRRKDFEEAGGFGAIENYLADDYKIGHILHLRGKNVALSPALVENRVPDQKIRHTLSHLIRWNRTIRLCNPVGYFFSVITQCNFLAFLALISSGFSMPGWMFFGMSSIIRILTCATIAFGIGSYRGIGRSVVAPLWDIVSSLLWAAGLAGKEVVWRNIRYAITKEGEMKKI